MRRLELGMLVVGCLFVQACASEPSRSTSSATAAAPATPRATSTAAVQKSPSATNVEILMNKIKADKKLLVASNMELTDAEAQNFWPLYDGYQKKLTDLNNQLGGTIMEYAEAYKKGPLPDSTASKLLDEMLNLEDAEVMLKKDFAQQFSRVLPDAKVARYLQIETKIRSLLKFELAREIPLVY
ncbi:MAG: hypothetical protein AB7G48_10590 [Nitrospiraceae bacterium]